MHKSKAVRRLALEATYKFAVLEIDGRWYAGQQKRAAHLEDAKLYATPQLAEEGYARDTAKEAVGVYAIWDSGMRTVIIK